MDKNNTTIVALLALITGLLIGYFSARAGWYDMQNGIMSMMGGKDDSGSMMEGADMHDSGMGDTMDAVMSGIEGKSGDTLEQAFLTEMIVHHEGAIRMSHTLLESTKRPELIKLANDIITAQEKEISMMKQWLKEWFAK